jgi:hypothetical protein
MAGLFISIFLSKKSATMKINKPKKAGIPKAAFSDHFKPTKIASEFGITPPIARQTHEKTAKSELP